MVSSSAVANFIRTTLDVEPVVQLENINPKLNQDYKKTVGKRIKSNGKNQYKVRKSNINSNDTNANMNDDEE